jgi:hypothetical protein
MHVDYIQHDFQNITPDKALNCQKCNTALIRHKPNHPIPQEWQKLPEPLEMDINTIIFCFK